MNVRRMWIVNVGDIKPAEAETEFFLDMAWDAKRWNAENAWKFAYQWAEEIFGKGSQVQDATALESLSSIAKAIGGIKTEYYRLAASGKPEHISLIPYSQDEIDEASGCCQTEYSCSLAGCFLRIGGISSEGCCGNERENLEGAYGEGCHAFCPASNRSR